MEGRVVRQGNLVRQGVSSQNPLKSYCHNSSKKQPFCHYLVSIYEYADGSEFFDGYSCVPKMRFFAVITTAYNNNAPFKEHSKVPMWIVFVLMLLLLNNRFKLGKELFNRIEIQGV